MFEKLTDRARRIMALANQAACRAGHEFIGTEHLLIGLIKEGAGIGPQVLMNLGVDTDQCLADVHAIAKARPDQTSGKLPYTPRAKAVIELAIEEARSLGHNYVGSEHLLVGLMCERDGVAAQVLMNYAVSLEAVRDEALRFLGVEQPYSEPECAECKKHLVLLRELREAIDRMIPHPYRS